MYEENTGFNNADDEFDHRGDTSENKNTAKVEDLSPEDLALLDLHIQRWYGDDQDLTIPLNERRQHALDEIPDLMETLRENARENDEEKQNAGYTEFTDEEDEHLQHQYIRGYGPGAEQHDLTWDKLSPEDLAMLDEYINNVETDDAPLEERRTRVLENVKGIMDILRALHEKDPSRDPMMEETPADWEHLKDQLHAPIARTEWERLSDEERIVGKDLLENMQKAGLYTDAKNRPLAFEDAMEQMLTDYPGIVQEQTREKRILQNIAGDKPDTQGLTKPIVLDTVLSARRTIGPCTP